MNDIKVTDETTRKVADVLYQLSRKSYKAGIRDACLGSATVLTGVAIGHLTVIIIKAAKKRSKKADKQD